MGVAAGRAGAQRGATGAAPNAPGRPGVPARPRLPVPPERDGSPRPTVPRMPLARPCWGCPSPDRAARCGTAARGRQERRASAGLPPSCPALHVSRPTESFGLRTAKGSAPASGAVGPPVTADRRSCRAAGHSAPASPPGPADAQRGATGARPGLPAPAPAPGRLGVPARPGLPARRGSRPRPGLRFPPERDGPRSPSRAADAPSPSPAARGARRRRRGWPNCGTAAAGTSAAGVSRARAVPPGAPASPGGVPRGGAASPPASACAPPRRRPRTRSPSRSPGERPAHPARPPRGGRSRP